MLRTLVKVAIGAVFGYFGYQAYQKYYGKKSYAAKGSLTCTRLAEKSTDCTEWYYVVRGDLWKLVAQDDPKAPEYRFQGTSSADNKTKKFDASMTFEGKTLDDLLKQIDSFY